MVSIIIPSFNHKRYIKKALDSVLDDSCEKKELIIIDDGSTDGSSELIKEWVEKNKDKIDVKFISRQNKGLTPTLNELIKLSSKDYILMLGSDDYLLKDSIKKRYEFLKKHPEYKIVICDSIVVDENDKKISDSLLFSFRPYKREQFLPQNLKDTLIKKFILAGPIAMIKKDIFDDIGLYDERFVAEDLDFYLRALSKYEVAFLDERLCAYRVHSSNQSIAGITPKLLRDSARSYIKNAKLYPLKYKMIMHYNAFKFFVREMLLRLKLLLSS